MNIAIDLSAIIVFSLLQSSGAHYQPSEWRSRAFCHGVFSKQEITLVPKEALEGVKEDYDRHPYKSAFDYLELSSFRTSKKGIALIYSIVGVSDIRIGYVLRSDYKVRARFILSSWGPNTVDTCVG